VHVFGILRPCRHSLPHDLATQWLSHLCGLCLALRDDYGQAARLATNYDGLMVSALVAAQTDTGRQTRLAGPCPLRGMLRAPVAVGAGARLAASVSLLLAATTVADHVADRDGVYGKALVRGAASRLSRHWAADAHDTGRRLGFDSGLLLTVLDRQREVEERVGPGSDLLEVTAPTEEATGDVFASTAHLAGRPGNEAPLREAGRLFGRIAHRVGRGGGPGSRPCFRHLESDRRHRNGPRPGTELCDDAVLGVRLALADAEFTDDRLVHALLVHELERAVRRVFAQAGYGGGHHRGPWGPAAGGPSGR